MPSGVLLLRLEAPLQSWGERSRWDVRDTADRLTKSGVIGLLGAAFGYSRLDSRLRQLSETLRFGVRVDRPGERMVDFQTVTGVLPRADGKNKGKEDDPYTIISPRSYLQDASFLVGLEGPMDTLKACKDALLRPKWPVYLGRKCCPPAVPVFQKLSEGVTLEAAFKVVGLAPRSGGQRPVVQYCEHPQGNEEVRDHYLATPAREYGTTRYVLNKVELTKESADVSE